MIKLLKNIKVNNYKKKIEKNVINIIIVMYQIKLEGDTYSNICKQEFYNLLLNEEYSKKNTEILIEELVFVLNTNHLVENLIKEFI